MKKYWLYGILIIICALVLTFISVWYERVVAVEERCLPEGQCSVSVVAGGFPFAYLYDQPQVAGESKLSFLEDEFHGIRFFADWFVHGMVVGTGIFLIIRLAKNFQSMKWM